MRSLLFGSSFNGLTQRVWIELGAAGHDVRRHVASQVETLPDVVDAFDPDVIMCPFLKERVPEEVWRRRPTIIIHPGPPGDRGPSSLDWAIADGATEWGVTALQAVEEMDAGPIWAHRTFPLGPDPARKSSLYNGAVADAAVALVHEVVAKAADPAFRPRPLDYAHPDVTGRLRPTMRQADRAFSWSDPTATVVRRIRAADGAPGVRTTLCGTAVSVFDAYPGPARPGEPGAVVLRSGGAVLVRTGDGGVWIGHVRVAGRGVKLPAAHALADVLPDGVADEPAANLEIGYRRVGPVGVLGFSFYNGAMSTARVDSSKMRA